MIGLIIIFHKKHKLNFMLENFGTMCWLVSMVIVGRGIF